jgi:hypothetical protein
MPNDLAYNLGCYTVRIVHCIIVMYNDGDKN